jgi:hypothetical protein
MDAIPGLKQSLMQAAANVSFPPFALLRRQSMHRPIPALL